MAPTVAQTQRFETTRDEIASYMQDLIDQEYQQQEPEQRTRGASYWREDVTKSQVWDELMMIWDEQLDG